MASSSPGAVEVQQTPHASNTVAARGLPAAKLGLATADINGLDRHGRTALHRAARKGNRTRIEQLVQAGADLEARTRKQGWTPLHVAALNGQAGVIPLLITPATLDALNDDEETPLEPAVSFQHLEAAAVLVAAGASLGGSANDYDAFFVALIILYKDKTSGKLAILLWDAVKGDPAAGQVLTEAAQRVDWRGWTVLHKAAGKGYQELVTRLLEAGADRDAVDHQGTTPLWQAVEGGYAHLVPLLATPANINLTNHELGRTALHHAAERGCLELVTRLLEASANRDAVGGDHATPLWLAASAGHAHLVPLLASPANVNMAATTSDGTSTPFLAAVEHCHYGAAAALLAGGASADCRDSEGRSALALAAHNGNAHDVALLLKALAACPCKEKQQQQQRAALNALLTETVASLVVKHWDAPRCCQVLEAIVDVLGPTVAGAVCVSVQQQIQQEVDRLQQQQQQPGPMPIVDPDVREWVKEWQGTSVPFSSLGDALLLVWARAVERLHAARQPLVARLQRQVLWVTNAGQQGQDEEWSLEQGEQKDGEEDCEQQQWQGHQEEAQQQGVREHSEVAGQQQSDQHDGEEQQQGQQDDESHHQQQECSEEQVQQQEGGHGKSEQGATDSSTLAELKTVVVYACFAAAEGREEDAKYRLQQFADIYLWHLEEGCTRDSTCAESAWCSHSPEDDHSESPFQALLNMGLSVAALSRSEEECNPDDKAPPEVCKAAWQRAQSFQPPQLYAIILGAWVQARRELQQLPREMAATVVAAVTVAQQQRQL